MHSNVETVEMNISATGRTTTPIIARSYYLTRDATGLALKAQRIMYKILVSDNLPTAKNVQKLKHVVGIAKQIDLSAHVRVNNYRMDVMSKNGNFTVIIRNNKSIFYNINGKSITQRLTQ
ncbi:hypothetical protein F-M6_0475 [Faustovirus]|nr:hypothetical protein F-LCD7_0471 [Faustovirus]QJX72238.1 hypothetical protein F-M6_0475 [Faustovirus]SMH63453.1 Hypothetical protein FSTVLC9_418 [Faustovirus]